MEELQLPTPAHTWTPRPPLAGEWIESVGGGEMGVEPGLVSGSGMSSFGPDAVSNTSMLDGARRGVAASTR